MLDDSETEKLKAGKALLMLAALVILIAGLLCWLAGLDFFILSGILAFFLNFIPVIGSIVADVPNAILVAGGYLLINKFLGNFFKLSLMGRRFGISSEQRAGLAEEKLLEVTPLEKSNSTPLSVGTESI